MLIKKLIFQFDNVFQGTPFYGTPFADILENIPLEKANNSIEKGHSIAQILAHILAWRTYCIEHVNGNDKYDIELGSNIDWPDIRINTDEEWDVLKNEIKNSQNTIIELLKEKKDEWLSLKLPGKIFSYNFMLKGLIQHDIYHLGQISLLKNIGNN